MHNPIRKNRNIGTSKQGHGQSNKLVIPTYEEYNPFYEKLGTHKVVSQIINGKEYRFVVEHTKKGYLHACTIEDIKQLISYLPEGDLGNIQLIVLRQPKRKEEILKPVWGRLVYSYAFKKDFFPAIILEAVNYSAQLRWLRKQCIEQQDEFERLKTDGHIFRKKNNTFVSDFTLPAVRNTQLFRTFLHELGHYVHYLNQVVQSTDKYEIDDYEGRWHQYWKLPSQEKEKYAHSYAERKYKELKEAGLLPFDRIVDELKMAEHGLQIASFVDE